ncbi:MAG: hypothetical protein ABEN55_16790, partial [Bradymonadaceae bacterium]
RVERRDEGNDWGGDLQPPAVGHREAPSYALPNAGWNGKRVGERRPELRELPENSPVPAIFGLPRIG